MKIAVLGYGSRGDAQPPLALAARLVADGHQVTVAVPGDFADVPQRLGARAVVVPSDLRGDLARGGLLPSLRAGRTFAFFREALQLERERTGQLQDRLLEATAEAELIVAPALLEDLCVSVAEARRQPLAFAFPMPVWPNATYPHVLFGAWDLPAPINLWSHHLIELGARDLLPLVNALRLRLGLAPTRVRPSLRFRAAAPTIVYWVPPQVLEPPAGFGPAHVFSGYWAPPPALRRALGETTPPEALRRFLEAGPPPVFVGFGSMPVVDERLVDRVEEAADALGLRVVLQRGHAAVERRGARLFLVDAVDHDWLLPRCAAAVHHGGAGTTGSAIRAGIPALVASVFADQPFWGRRVRALGVGETLRFQRLDATALTRGLARVLRPAVVARARMLAAELAAAPDGLAVAARALVERSHPIPG